MNLVMFVLSVVGVLAGAAFVGSGVAMLRGHNGKSNSNSILKPKPSVKIENGKGDVFSMLKDMDSKLSTSDEHTDLMVVPEQAQSVPSEITLQYDENRKAMCEAEGI